METVSNHFSRAFSHPVYYPSKRRIKPSRIRALSNSIEERYKHVRSSVGSNLSAHGKEVTKRLPSEGEIDLPNENDSLFSNGDARSYKGNKLVLSVSQLDGVPKHQSVNEDFILVADEFMEDEASNRLPPTPLSQDSSNQQEEGIWGYDTTWLKVANDPLKSEHECKSKNVHLSNLGNWHLCLPRETEKSSDSESSISPISQSTSEISGSLYLLQRSKAMSPVEESLGPKKPKGVFHGVLVTPKRNKRLHVQDYCASFKQDFFWDQDMYAATIRRRNRSRRKRAWDKLNIQRIIENMDKVGQIVDTKSYYSVFRLNNGRTEPCQELFLSFIWTSVFLCLHKNYGDLCSKLLNFPFEPWYDPNLNIYFGVALGYLLYMQAASSSKRWVEARVQWQSIIDNSKRLALLLCTNLSSLRLAKYGTRLILGHTICVRNYLQERADLAWKENMLEVLDKKFVGKIMGYQRDLRHLAVVYGLQRLVEYSIEKKILPKEVIRDINPTLVQMGHSLGACNRIRNTKLPWIIYLHLQFILCVFIIALPLSLEGLHKLDSEGGTLARRLSIWEIYAYGIILTYAFFGLSRMAIEIDNPFSFTRENHSFGFWGFYTFWSVAEMVNLQTIFGFRAIESSNKLLQDGIYGNKWTVEKLETPIRRIVDTNLPKAHNLYGRTEDIRNQLDQDKRKSSYWAELRIDPSDDFSCFTFGTDSEDEKFPNSQSHVRDSICYDQKQSPGGS